MGGHHVFISYSSTDDAYASALAQHLEEQGIEVWRDEDDLAVGTPSYSKAIQSAIRQSAALVVIMTPAADASAWVGNEVEEARHTGKPIFPLLLDGEPLFGLKLVQYEQVQSEVMPSAKFTASLRKAVAAAHKREADEAAAREREEEEAAARQREADKAAARQREAEEAAARQREAEEAAARQREAEEAAARQREAEEAAARQRAQAEALRREAEEARAKKRKEEVKRLLKFGVIGVGAVVVVAGLIVSIVALAGDDDGPQEGGGNGGTGASSTVPSQVAAEVGFDPRSMALGFDSLWVTITGEDAVWRLDPATLEVEARIDVGTDPQDVAVAPAGVWVSNTGDGTVQRIEPSDNSADDPVSVDEQPFGIYAASDTLWVAHVGGRSVVGVDLASGDVTQRIPFDAFLTDVVERDGVLWVASWVNDDRMWRVPLDDPVPTLLEVGTQGANPQILATHDDYVFAIFRGTGELARYTPDGTLDARLTPPGVPTAITVEGDDVWLGADLDGGSSSAVIGYDATTLEPSDELSATDRTFAVDAEGTSVWFVLNRGPEEPGAVRREERPS